jgi:hypothetical protein
LSILDTNYTHINPDSLILVAVLGVGLLQLRLKLCSDKSEHILTTTEEDLSSSIISPGLLLVKALKGVLLVALGTALVGFDERGVEEEEKGFNQPWGFVLALAGED